MGFTGFSVFIDGPPFAVRLPILLMVDSPYHWPCNRVCWNGQFYRPTPQTPIVQESVKRLQVFLVEGFPYSLKLGLGLFLCYAFRPFPLLSDLRGQTLQSQPEVFEKRLKVLP